MTGDRKPPDPAPATPDDPLAIPEFLKREKGSSTRRSSAAPKPAPYRSRLPPESMVPVLRAIRRGKDTMQKLRASLGDKYSDSELRSGIGALLRIGSIHRVGRRYRPIQLQRPPPREKRP